MIAVGDTVGNYRVTAKLGEGGMGQVFLAEHPVIGSKVAIKAVHSHFARNPEVVSRFVTEARAVNQIGHDHIVSITDFATTPAGDFYFVMEYLQGEMLADQIGRKTFSPARAFNIAAQIADALQASHDQGVIHRDLKPGNVLLVEREGTPDFVKVFDFGLAKLTGKDGTVPTHSTGAGIVMGTPFYMSPEQCSGNAEVDHRCDIYALGVILFEMLTGRVPFTGDGYGEVMLKHVNEPPPSARGLIASLPPAVDEVLARAMAKTPAARYQSMAELRGALLELEAALSPPPVVVNRTTPISRPSVMLAGAGELIDSGALRPRRQHHGVLMAGLAALVVAVIANFGFRRASVPMAAATPDVAGSRGPRNPDTVRVNFSSDPIGATVLRKDGSVIGTTPLSTDVAYSETPVDVVIVKSGFAPKPLSFVPNMPIPVVAVLRKEQAPENRPETAMAAARNAPARPRVARAAAPSRPAHRSQADIDHDDDVLAPTTW